MPDDEWGRTGFFSGPWRAQRYLLGLAQLALAQPACSESDFNDRMREACRNDARGFWLSRASRGCAAAEAEDKVGPGTGGRGLFTKNIREYFL